MSQASKRILVWALAAWLPLSGCGMPILKPGFHDEMAYFEGVATDIEYPDVASETEHRHTATEPLTVDSDVPGEYWDLSLEEAIRMALTNSQVLRDLGGAVLRAPEASETIYGPALAETDPRIGVEAALADFDALFRSNAMFEKNDRALNNAILGGGTRLLQQDVLAYEAEISKRSVTGGQFAVRKLIDYDENNAPSNLFLGAWTTQLEVEARHPLLRGRGVQINRILGGRDQIPGQFRGVLVARLNSDVRLADFELALRDLVSNVENTYWDLYFAYRDLDAKIAARDASLETWRRVKAQGDLLPSWKESQAREQYFRFKEEVENALTGRLLDGTRTNNGSRGGTFRGLGGVHVVERRLRMLIGLPASDGRLIRPANEPTMAEVVFDWHEASQEAMMRRAELRRQKWVIKRRQLELAASRNFLMPRLDTVGRYRWRGFGKSLIDANSDGSPRFDNAYADLTTGDFQEWAVGAELEIPIGYRRAHTQVRNAELRLAEAKAVLDEQEHQIIHSLSNMLAELDRAYQVAQTAYNRREAARQQLESVAAANEAGRAPLDQLLNAQRRMAEADSGYHRARVEFMLAVKNVHFEKGSLLDHNEIFLAEGPWPMKAYYDAAKLERRRGKPHNRLNYVFGRNVQVSRGPYLQQAPRDVDHLEQQPTELLEAPLDSDGEVVPPASEPAANATAPEDLVGPELPQRSAEIGATPRGSPHADDLPEAATLPEVPDTPQQASKPIVNPVQLGGRFLRELTASPETAHIARQSRPSATPSHLVEPPPAQPTRLSSVPMTSKNAPSSDDSPSKTPTAKAQSRPSAARWAPDARPYRKPPSLRR